MYERALSAINLEPTDRVPQMEFLAHTQLISKVSGLDPQEHPDEALRRTYDALDLDMVFSTWDPLHPWDLADRDSDLFQLRKDSWSSAYPTTWRTRFEITTVEEMLEFDPFEAWEPPEEDQLAARFSCEHAEKQAFYRNQLVTGGKYQTCFMWLIMQFGLQLTAKAAFQDPKRFRRLVDRFGELSLREFRAWARTDIKAFISHDDICSTNGPFFSPKWYRSYVFPWYKRCWHELRSEGIRVLFCSDGDMTMIVGDIARAGADGFVIEECCDLSYIVNEYGRKKAIIGGVDAAVLTYGSPDDAVREVKRCLRLAGGAPGYFLNVSGSIPDNVPLPNLEAYFQACRTYGKRPLRLD